MARKKVSKLKILTSWYGRKDRHIAALEKQADSLLGTLQHMQEVQNSCDPLTGTEIESTTPDKRTGNPYKSYDAQVSAIALKFNVEADWGNQQVGNILKVRSFFMAGNGIKPVFKEGGEDSTREMDFIKDFIRINGLDGDVPQIWAKEAGIEGKFLARIEPMADPDLNKLSPARGNVKAIYVPWTLYAYQVVTPKTDYTDYLRVIYTHPDTNKKSRWQPEEFTYTKFGGRVDEVNCPSPSLAAILKQIEDLDKGLWDWRHINHIMSRPTPVVTFEDADDAAAFQTQTAARQNWKIGQLLVLGGGADFQMVVPDAAAVEAIEREIIMLAKIISGATGVPVHFLGLPDLLSNRATADNLIEMIIASTNDDRQIWKSFYEDLFKSVLEMANAELKTGFLNTSAIGVQIPDLSAAQLSLITDVFLPLQISGIVSKEYVRERMPNVDPAKEEKRVKKEFEEDPVTAALEVGVRTSEGNNDQA